MVQEQCTRNHVPICQELNNDLAACMTLQALQQELGRATVKANGVSAMETQLTAARRQMAKVLEDLQVSWAFHSTVYNDCSLQQPKLTVVIVFLKLLHSNAA